MHAAHPPSPLPAWLELGLAAHAGGIVVARQGYSLRAVDIDQPALILPLHGTKVFTGTGAPCTVCPGGYLMLHGAVRGTVENLPDRGDYRAWFVGFPWRVIELARSLINAHVPAAVPGGPPPAVLAASPPAALAVAPALPSLSSPPIRPGSPLSVPALHAGQASQPIHSSGVADVLYPALRYLLEALGGRGDAAVDHALLGVLLALHRAGDARFLLAHDLSVAARIRLLVAAAPARDWCSADFEERLHMSGATLRRRLADDETSLRIVLRDARLHHGLMLLQTTGRPLQAIAAACGYRSMPSFSRQFEARFGTPPQAVGGESA